MHGGFDTDVAVVGAGVVGCGDRPRAVAVRAARDAARGGSDVGAGTSKANTAMLHTGFDAKPGTLEARLVARGYELLSDVRASALASRSSARARCSWPGTRSSSRAFAGIVERRARQRVRRDCESSAPTSSTGASRTSGPARSAPSRWPARRIICPFTTPLAFATEAVLAGCELRRSTPVTRRRAARRGRLRARDPGRARRRAGWVVNAAGLRADEIDRMLGHERLHGHAAARRADRLRQARAPAGRPDRPGRCRPRSPRACWSRPTVFGNVMLGPTAEDVERQGRHRARPRPGSTTCAPRARASCRRCSSTRSPPSYVGLRAATEHVDYQVSIHAEERLRLRRRHPLDRADGLDGDRRARARAARRGGPALEPRATEPPAPRMPNIGEAFPRPYARGGPDRADPEYGRIVCFCERVTARGDPRRPRAARAARRPRRAAPPHPRAYGPLPGVLLRRRSWRALLAERASAAERPGRGRRRPGRPGWRPPIELRRRGSRDVLVLEREGEPGGIPRHARHQGFGLRDLRRALTGPAYARRCAELARPRRRRAAGRDDGHGLGPDGALELTGAARARAAGAGGGCAGHRLPRAAALGPARAGSRPAGVMTTGTLQQLVYLRGRPARPPRPLVVGAEHVSFSALLTLAHGGARAVAMVTELPRHQSLAAFRAGARAALPGLRSGRARAVSAIRGRAARGGGGADRPRQRPHAERGVRHRRLQRRLDPRPRAGGAGWTSSSTRHARAGGGRRAAHLARRGCSRRATCCTEPRQADVAALSGRHAAAGVAAFLHADGAGAGASACRSCASRRSAGSLRTSVAAGAGAPARGHFALRASEHLTRAADSRSPRTDRVLWRGRARPASCPVAPPGWRTTGPRGSSPEGKRWRFGSTAEPAPGCAEARARLPCRRPRVHAHRGARGTGRAARARGRGDGRGLREGGRAHRGDSPRVGGQGGGSVGSGRPAGGGDEDGRAESGCPGAVSEADEEDERRPRRDRGGQGGGRPRVPRRDEWGERRGGGPGPIEAGGSQRSSRWGSVLLFLNPPSLNRRGGHGTPDRRRAGAAARHGVGGRWP